MPESNEGIQQMQEYTAALSHCLVMLKGYRKDAVSSAFTWEKLLPNAKAATIRTTAKHEGQDVSQLPLQFSLVAEAIGPRALSGTSTGQSSHSNQRMTP